MKLHLKHQFWSQIMSKLIISDIMLSYMNWIIFECINIHIICINFDAVWVCLCLSQQVLVRAVELNHVLWKVVEFLEYWGIFLRHLMFCKKFDILLVYYGN